MQERKVGLQPETTRRVLESWSEIAAYLKRSVSAVQRWEREEGLPVHRHVHRSQGTVYAYTDEIDAWRAARSVRKHTASPEAAAAVEGAQVAVPPSVGWLSPKRLRLLAVAAVILTLAVVAASGRLQRRPPGASRSYLLASTPDIEAQVSLSPDGSTAAFVQTGVKGSHILLRAVAGGEPRRLTQTSENLKEAWPAWSRDGSKIAFARIGDSGVAICVTSSSGGAPREVTRLEDRSLAALGDIPLVSWSPDGRSWIISDRPNVSEPVAIYSVLLENGARKRLTEPPPGIVGDTDGRISPDGKNLAFVRRIRGFEWDIYVMPLSGGSPRRITNDLRTVRGMDWTPDSQALVFSSNRESALHSLWRISADGQTPATRLPGSLQESVSPSVSRLSGNGYRIAYQSVIRSVNLKRWTSPFSTAAPQDLCPSTRFDWFAQLSPDGRRVVFSSNRSGASNIWVCEEDGRARQLTQFLEAYTDSPRWSPSGDKILLTTRLGESREVLELDLKTNRIRQITDHPADDGRATYSRDGTTIFFRSDRSGRNEIWRVPASGGEARQLTKNGAMEGFGSPDGKLLYYTKDRPQLGVWSIPIAGGPETKVTGEVRDTRWAVADDGIYYLTTVAPLRIMRYAFATRQTTEVAQLPGSAQVWAGFSASPDGKVFVWPQTALDSSDIAILDFQP